jgi:hypothetical protein
MELWLLGAGAVVLIAITLWIVWPSSTADTVGTTTVPIEEERPMTQYTSPTADTATGGVETAADPMRSERDEASHHWAPSGAGLDYRSQTESHSMMPSRTIGMGAGALLSIGGAIGGAWLYARWQRERNKPINRLRRGARDVASRLGERMPDVEDLPHGAAPMSGAATALLLTGLVASRAMRRNAPDHREELRDQATDLLTESLREALGRGRDVLERGRDVAERGRDVAERGRKQSRRMPSRVPTDRLPDVESRRPAIFGIGFGGLAVLIGGTYVIWRLLRGGGGNTGTSWTSYTAD